MNQVGARVTVDTSAFYVTNAARFRAIGSRGRAGACLVAEGVDHYHDCFRICGMLSCGDVHYGLGADL